MTEIVDRRQTPADLFDHLAPPPLPLLTIEHQRRVVAQLAKVLQTLEDVTRAWLLVARHRLARLFRRARL
jgi:hypothetical protein